MAGARRTIVDDASISERPCREWFQRSNNGDFNVDDRMRPRPMKKF